LQERHFKLLDALNQIVDVVPIESLFLGESIDVLNELLGIFMSRAVLNGHRLQVISDFRVLSQPIASSFLLARFLLTLP
jgi:hypothetical protein